MLLDILTIAALLYIAFMIYQMYLQKKSRRPIRRGGRNRPYRSYRPYRQEGFAFERSPQPTSLGPYKCYQNDYRPEVITSFGEYPTVECEQSLCHD